MISTRCIPILGVSNVCTLFPPHVRPAASLRCCASLSDPPPTPPTPPLSSYTAPTPPRRDTAVGRSQPPRGARLHHGTKPARVGSRVHSRPSRSVSTWCRLPTSKVASRSTGRAVRGWKGRASVRHMRRATERPRLFRGRLTGTGPYHPPPTSNPPRPPLDPPSTPPRSPPGLPPLNPLPSTRSPPRSPHLPPPLAPPPEPPRPQITPRMGLWWEREFLTLRDWNVKHSRCGTKTKNVSARGR